MRIFDSVIIKGANFDNSTTTFQILDKTGASRLDFLDAGHFNLNGNIGVGIAASGFYSVYANGTVRTETGNIELGDGTKALMFGGGFSQISSDGSYNFLAKFGGYSFMNTGGVADVVITYSGSSAKLGVGTTSPNYKISVAGNNKIAWEKGSYSGSSKAWSIMNDRWDFGDLAFETESTPGGGTDTLRFIIGNTGTGIGNIHIPTASLHIKADGSTSSTKSIYTENSVGTQTLSLLDNGVLLVGNTTWDGYSKMQIAGSYLRIETGSQGILFEDSAGTYTGDWSFRTGSGVAKFTKHGIGEAFHLHSFGNSLGSIAGAYVPGTNVFRVGGDATKWSSSDWDGYHKVVIRSDNTGSGSFNTTWYNSSDTLLASLRDDGLFTVNGSIKMVDGNQGSGKVLTSDASGNATWSAPASGVQLLHKDYTIVASNDPTPTLSNGTQLFHTVHIPAGKLTTGDFLELKFLFETISTAPGNVGLILYYSDTNTFDTVANQFLAQYDDTFFDAPHAKFECTLVLDVVDDNTLEALDGGGFAQVTATSLAAGGYIFIAGAVTDPVNDFLRIRYSALRNNRII